MEISIYVCLVLLFIVNVGFECWTKVLVLLRTHNGEKGFLCEMCVADFIHKSECFTHQRNDTLRENF